MLLSLTSTTPDATDLGFLLHKHPDRVRTVDVGFGRAHVFYPEASVERCTASLFVEVDPVALARGRRGGRAPGSEPYVNDRPYVASSMLSVALGRLFGTALNGSCEARPELVGRPLDLQVEIPVLAARGGPELVRRLFEPLGHEVEATPIPLDDSFPQWGHSRYVSLRLVGRSTVQALLQQLSVLMPVLDDRKHYWVGSDEVDKLLRRAGHWLPTHPEAELITRRYLRVGGLAREALTRLAESGEDPDDLSVAQDEAEQGLERPISLNDQRLAAVMAAVRAAGGGRVVDLGCGEGRLLQRLVREPAVTEVLGVDVSIGAIERAEKRLRLDEMSERRRQRVSLIQGALTYTDDRIRGFDIATVVEVIEHIDVERLDAFAQALFADAAPSVIVLTTPNREYNATFEPLGGSGLRHGDHRFEWTRAEFTAWAEEVGSRFGYRFELSGVGADDPALGPPTQMAVFRR
jgi:3' terminal RNA ribose 2'-O-methyltransferase Hen1